MKQGIFVLVGTATLLMTAACHKAAPVAASHPAETTPVAPAQQAPMAQRPAQRASTPPAATPERRSAVMTPEQRADLNEKLARLEDALFDYNKSTIRTDASTALRDDVGVIRDILANFPSQKLLVEGHCDERGSDEYNLALGDKRAHAVEDFLSSLGIPQSQLTVISYGRGRPVCTDATESCWQRNRRAHVTAAP